MMKGFDLYRITFAYLGVIFVVCAMVLYDPLRWIWPAGQSPALQGLAVAPDADDLPLLSPLPGADRDAAGGDGSGALVQVAPVDPVDPVDPAEIVANLVAEKFFADFGEEQGEGDASVQVDMDLNPQHALVAAGSDVAYTVAVGDSLGSLALRFYGESALSSMIYEANRGLMASPDRLRVGQVVIIPGRR